jgi:hypothetical protein
MAVLAQFLLRLCFGLAVGMGITSSRDVASGFFRNHLYVTLGLATLAALSGTGLSWVVVTVASLVAACSYVGSVSWLYEATRLGKWMIWWVAGLSLFGAWAVWSLEKSRVLAESSVRIDLPNESLANPLWLLSTASSGLVLGLTTATMLLGHWYLNAPGMNLAPLRRLLVAMAAAVGLQMVVSAVGLASQWQLGASPASGWLMFVVLRWSFGLVGVLALVWMAWKTLEIPNTQSATGILYVAVIGAFGGELMSVALSRGSAFPL